MTIARSLGRHPWIWLAGILVTVLPCGWVASHLSLQSDFKNLLPETRPSVITLNQVVKRVGGIGNLIVAVESTDYKATERFIEDFVAKLKALPPNYIRYIEYHARDVRKFYTDNKYLYIDLVDLRKIHDRFKDKIMYEKLKQNPLYIALEEEEVGFDMADLEAKYKGQTSKYDKYRDGYFFDEKAELAAVMIQPFGSSTGTKTAKALIDRVNSIIDELKPTTYHPSMKVDMRGKYKTNLDEYDQLIRDVIETLALCLLLISIVIYLYFLRFRAIWLLTLPLVVGVTWTFALTQLQIGYLNSQTAFLGSIIVGNGVNSGIILLARYLEERRKERVAEEAIVTAIMTTWVGTITAALTTSAAFAALGISDIKGFSHFGFIGGIGMILCWVATYVVLPPLLVISDKILPIVRGRRFISKQWETVLYPIGSLVAYSPKIIATAGILVMLASLALAVRYMPNSLEYDFSQLSNKETGPPLPPGQKGLNARIREIFNQNLSPSVILLDREEQAQWVCDAVMASEASLTEKEKTIDSCKTLRSFLPTQQEEKLVVLAKLKRLLADRSLNFVKGKYREELDAFRKEVALRKLELKDLPESMRRNFQESDGSLGRIVYVYPRTDANLSDGRRLIKFVDRLSDIKLPDGSSVRMSGDSAIFADLLRTVKKEGPSTMTISFVGVFLFVILAFRRVRPTVYVIGGLVMGVLFMMGMQAILGIKLNFFNFIAYPVTFGIGVDYGVNLLQRYRFEGRGSMRRVLGVVGGAILLCSMTTTIGYVTLLPATNRALASFGWLALIGELSCLFAAIVIMPAVLHSFDKPHAAIPNAFVEKRKVPR